MKSKKFLKLMAFLQVLTVLVVGLPVIVLAVDPILLSLDGVSFLFIWDEINSFSRSFGIILILIGIFAALYGYKKYKKNFNGRYALGILLASALILILNHYLV